MLQYLGDKKTEALVTKQDGNHCLLHGNISFTNRGHMKFTQQSLVFLKSSAHVAAALPMHVSSLIALKPS